MTGYGYDYNKNFIKYAKLNNPSINFNYMNINNIKSINLKFDVISLLEVLDYFDSYKIIIKNCLNLFKLNGKLIIHANFNDYDIDVLIKYKTLGTKSFK